MGNAFKIFVLSVAIAATLMTAGRKQQTSADSNPMAVRQVAYVMRAIHNMAITLKSNSPADTGVLTQFLPAYLTDQRFTACADASYVATWTNTFTFGAACLTALTTAVQRQIIFPPGQYASFFLPAGYRNGVTAGNAVVPNIGIAQAQDANGDPQTVSTVFGLQSMPAGCQAATGSLVILTKVF